MFNRGLIVSPIPALAHCCLAIVLLTAGAAFAEDLDARFVAGLRERGLIDLAEEFATERLSKLASAEGAYADVSIELMRTLVVHAYNAPSSECEALWTKAHSVADKVLRQSPPHPRIFFVRFENAVVFIAQAELVLSTSPTAKAPAADADAARLALRQATNALELLAKDLKTHIPSLRRSAPKPPLPSAEEHSRLDEQIHFQLARANRNRALLYESGTSDRVSLLLAAITELTQLLTQLSITQPFYASAQLELAEVNRLLGRHDEAIEIATAVDKDENPRNARLQARSVLLRVAMDKHDWTSISRLLDGAEERPTAEFDFVRLEAFLALARAEERRSSGKAAAEYHRLAAKQAKLLAGKHGNYWGRRANHLLFAALPRAGISSDILSQIADNLYFDGDFDKAASAYDEAAGQAKATGDARSAFTLTYKAALVEQKQEKQAEAASRLRRLANDMPTHPQASDAHLLAAWNAAKAGEKDPDASALYEALLLEHLATWSDSKTADQARRWLNELHDQNPRAAAAERLAAERLRLETLTSGGHRSEALKGYRQLAEQNPDNGAIQQTYAKLLLESADPGELNQALAQWRLVASRLPPRTPEWFEAKYSVALALFKLGDKSTAATLLHFLLETSPGLKGTEWDEPYRGLLKRCES